ncbi:hypothetical protein HKX48_003365 [Thoreauomyces humboldtii]|nr:hypothetical protein HKX48_003365 [Thoreauomyces humboldtii]
MGSVNGDDSNESSLNSDDPDADPNAGPVFRSLVAKFAFPQPSSSVPGKLRPRDCHTRQRSALLLSSSLSPPKTAKRALKPYTRPNVSLADPSPHLDPALFPPLTDIITPGLDVLFVGINPGLQSSSKGQHYAGPTNHFWPCLSLSGLTNGEVVTCKDDTSCPSRFALGFTNIIPRCTPGTDTLTSFDYSSNLPALVAKIAASNPLVVCCVGIGVFRTLAGIRTGEVRVGLHQVKGVCSRVFAMPSTSGRVRGVGREDRVQAFKELARCVALAKSEERCSAAAELVKVESET